MDSIHLVQFNPTVTKLAVMFLPACAQEALNIS